MKDNALSSYMKCPECLNLGSQSVEEWLPAVKNTVGRHSWQVEFHFSLWGYENLLNLIVRMAVQWLY